MNKRNSSVLAILAVCAAVAAGVKAETPRAPGAFADCEVVSHETFAGGAAPVSRRLFGGSGTAANDAAMVERWVVRAAGEPSRTYAVVLKAGSSGAITMCAYTPNRVLATLAAGKSYAEFEAAIEAKGLRVVRELMEDLEGNKVYIIEASESERDIVEQMTMSIESTGACTKIQPDHIYQANAVPNDTEFPNQWALAKISAPQAWETRTDASGVVVAVLDTGVNYDHIDLNANLWRNEDDSPGDGIDNDGNGIIDDYYGIASIGGNQSGNPMDDNSHGSHCAGVIGAVGNNRRLMSGVAWKASIMGLKFLDSGGNGSASDAITCLRYAEEHGAKIVSCSFGTSEWDEYLYIQMKKMAAKGTIFVCAAGNAQPGAAPRDNDLFPCYPCNYPIDTIIGVAATDAGDELASFSNYGAQNVDIGAPGVDINSTVLETLGLGLKSGTSMATPHVAGALALLAAHYPEEDAAALIERLYASAEPVVALKGKVRTGARLSLAGFFGLAAPTEISVSQGTVNDAVALYWAAVSGATHYRVWRSGAEGGDKTMLSDWSTGLTFSDTTAEPGVEYLYYLQAAASAGGEMASTYSVGTPGHRAAVDASRITVAFDPCGGTVSPAAKKYSIGRPYGEFPAPACAGKTFLGWHTAASGGMRLDESCLAREDASVLYARWSDEGALRVERLFARQRYPWNGYVDITFELLGVPQDETASVTLAAREEGAEQSALAVRTFVGAAPVNLSAGAQHFIWNATPDTRGVLYTNMVLAAAVALDEKPLSAPQGLVASDGTDADAVALSWQAAENASSYEIWRAESANFGAAARLGSTTSTTYRDTSAVPARRYTYWVKAAASGKTSEPGAPATGSRKKIAVSLSVSGPSSVRAGATAFYTCTAAYNDASTAAVSPAWSITTGAAYASVSSAGVVSAAGTAVERSLVLSAAYTADGTTQRATFPVKVAPYTVAITFDANASGVSVAPAARNYTAFGAYSSLPAPGARTGYSFAGWFTDAKGGEQVLESSTVPAADATLYAHWTPLTYNIILDRQGGTGGSSSAIATYAATVPAITPPAKTGHAFTGYFTEQDGAGTKYYDASGAGLVAWQRTAALTLYAAWQSLAPAAPTGLAASSGRTDGIQLSWNAAESATSYEIYRAASNNSAAAVKVATVSATSWIDATVASGTTYWYWVKAVSAGGASAFSPPASGSMSAVLASVEIEGPEALDSLCGGYYTAWAYFSDGTRRNIASSGVPALASQAAAGISNYGPEGGAYWRVVTASNVTSLATATLNASYTSDGVTKSASLEIYILPAGSQTWTYRTRPDGTAELTGYLGNTNVTELSLPADVNGFEITRTVGMWLYKLPALEKVSVPASFTEIAPNMFQNCRKLSTVAMPETIGKIADGSFYSCTALRQISLPQNLREIGSKAFDNCTALERIVVPPSVARIGAYAFSFCTALAEAILPESVSVIGSYAFQSCTSLATLEIPDAVENVDTVFIGCSSLSTVTLPEMLSDINGNAFSGCTNLKTIAIGAGSERFISVSGVLFDKAQRRLVAYPAARSGSSYSIPATVEMIGTRAFREARNLSSITLGAAVTTIESEVFFRCAKLQAIAVSASNPAYASVSGVLYNKNKTRLVAYPSGKTDAAYIMPDSVRFAGGDGGEVGYGASVTNIVLSDSLERFSDSRVKTSEIKLPASLRSLETYGGVAVYDIPATLQGTLYSGNTAKWEMNCFGDAPANAHSERLWKSGKSRRFAEATGWDASAFAGAGSWEEWENPVETLEITGENKVFEGTTVQLAAEGGFASGHSGMPCKASWMVVSGSAYATVDSATGLLAAKTGIGASARTVRVYAQSTLGGGSASAGQYSVQIVPANVSTLLATGRRAYNRLRFLPRQNAAAYNIYCSATSDFADSTLLATLLPEASAGETETFVDSSAPAGELRWYRVEALDSAGAAIGATGAASAVRSLPSLAFVRDTLARLASGELTPSGFKTPAAQKILRELEYWKGVNASWMEAVRADAPGAVAGANEMLWRSLEALDGAIERAAAAAHLAPPPALAFAPVASGAVKFSWEGVFGATGYEIWRASSADPSAASRIATTTSPECTLSPTASTQYYYWVRVVSADGISDFGEPVAYMPYSSESAYIVVDLSAGPDGAAYPLYSLSAVPFSGWTDEFKTTKLVLRRIASGSFTMGSPTNEVGRLSGETQHTVTISKPFYMGVFEVTQKQYELVMGSNPSIYKGDTRPVEEVSWTTIRGNSGWPSSSGVSASSFMGKLCEKTGIATFDLPTEAKWEYACRAGTTTALNSGKNLTNTDSDANMAAVGRYASNQSDGKGGYSQHTRVGLYAPNNWGLYDMHGNVAEWCLDRYSMSMGILPVVDPAGPVSGSSRVLRGGSYYMQAQYCRSAYRTEYQSQIQSNCIWGFRLCCATDDESTRTITYNANGGSGAAYTQVATLGASVALTANRFTRSGWTFLGWARTADGPVAYADGASITVTEGFTLYAKWTRQLTATYVIIDLSGGADASSYPVTTLSSVPSGGWTDEFKTTKLVLRRISSGSFTMGSPANEVGRFSYETQHSVTISKPFYMGVFEVTQKQYELVMGSNPSSGKGDMRPVEQVSWDMIRGNSGWPSSSEVSASSFMGKLRAKTGIATFDLPTEAKWEYACRAGTTTALNSGKNLTSTSSDANMAAVGRYFSNQSDGKGGYSSGHTKVGSYAPNNWGLYDMHGNAWEWCLDWYQADLGTAAVTDPVGPASGGARVRRGGSWNNYAQGCRSADRDYYPPSYTGAYGFLGFRLSCPAGL